MAYAGTFADRLCGEYNVFRSSTDQDGVEVCQMGMGDCCHGGSSVAVVVLRCSECEKGAYVTEVCRGA